MLILTLNCRRYSVQYQLFDWRHLVSLACGTVERIVVGDSFITHEVPGRTAEHREAECADHRDALKLILATLTDSKIGVLSRVGQISAASVKLAMSSAGVAATAA